MTDISTEALYANRTLTPTQLRAANPALADAVAAMFRDAQRARFTRALTQLSADLQAKVAAIDLSAATDPVSTLTDKLRAANVTPADIKTVVDCARRSGLGHAMPDRPIAAQPEVASKISVANVQTVTKLAGLSTTAAASVGKVATSPSLLDDAAIGGLVSSGALTAAQGKSLGFSVALFELTGEDATLATAVQSATFAPLGNKAAASVDDLAKLAPSDWASFLTSTKTALPMGATAQTAGAALAARFALLAPNAAVFGRLPQPTAATVSASVTALAPLYALNTSVVGADISTLVTTGLTAAQLATLTTAQIQLRQLANAYPGLQLATALDDKTSSAGAKAATVTRRIGLVQAVETQLGATQLMRRDLSANSTDLPTLGLAKLDATAAEQTMVLETVKAYQRVWAIANDIDAMHSVVTAGYASALAIATQPRGTFVAQTAATSLDDQTASAVWSSARVAMADSSMTTAAILDFTGPAYTGLKVRNLPTSAQYYLAQLPGYQDLFGRLSYCNCTDCQSIIGPAAYFVDLMKFIDDYLRSTFKKAGNPIDIAVRRPDLWTLQLTCDNIDDLVPTLEIVDEILENYIARRLKPTIALSGVGARAAIDSLVYDTTFYEPFKTTAPVPPSFLQPFLLPQARIATYLPALGSSLAAVSTALGADAQTQARAELDLSTPELAIATTLVNTLAQLSTIYSYGAAAASVATANGIPFAGSTTAVNPVDAVALCQATGWSRGDLGTLTTTAFVKASAPNILITATKVSAQSVQNDIEWVTGLTADGLDRMHRFTRVVRKTGWSISDLDLLLSALADTTLAVAGIENVAQAHALRSQFELSIGDLCALAGDIPQLPAGTSAFDAMFNSAITVDALMLPQPTVNLVLPSLLQAPVPPGAIVVLVLYLPRLLTGLGVDLEGLTALVTQIGSGLTSSGNNAGFALSIDNLSLLYRHVVLARMFDLSIDDFVALLGVAGIAYIAPQTNTTLLAQVATLVDIFQWWSQSGYTLDDVAVAMGKTPRNPSNYVAPAVVEQQAIADAATALSFDDTIFSVALGVTEQGSQQLIAWIKPTVLATNPDGSYSLLPGVDLATISFQSTDVPDAWVSVPATATKAANPMLPVTPQQVISALVPHQPIESLKRTLAKAFGTTTDKVASIMTLAGQSVTKSVLSDLTGVTGGADLVNLIAAIVPLTVAFEAAAWNSPAPAAGAPAPTTDSTIDFVALPAVATNAFGGQIPSPGTTTLSLAQLRALSVYARMTARQLAASPPGKPADLQNVLVQAPSAWVANPSAASLARVLGMPTGLIASLLQIVTLPATGAIALDQLDRLAQLAKSLGVQGGTLVGLTSADFTTLAAASAALQLAYAAKQPDATTRTSAIAKLEQPLLEARRDALADYLFNSISPRIWSTFDELYDYFLIDVESGGCAETSWVVSATTSAQLYVNRAILRLEKNDAPVWDTTDYLEIVLCPEAEQEWVWRKNYRVWQANREVFLWPENYLVPDLRDNKTPLFEDLENQLLQTALSDQDVIDAYTAYLAGFETLAKLQIAGAYLEPGSQTPDGVSTGDVLHLFGATSDDTPTIYYRTCENLFSSNDSGSSPPIWSNWQKVDAQITSSRVSPVVVNGRLMLFWTTISSKAQNNVVDGSSVFANFLHTMQLYVTWFRPDETWSTPQNITLPTDLQYFWPSGGQIFDPMISSSSDQVLLKYGGVAINTTSSGTNPANPVAPDGYTLSGFEWDWAWPGTSGTAAGPELVLRNFVEDLEVDVFGRTSVKADNIASTATAWTTNPVPLVAVMPLTDSAYVDGGVYSATPAQTMWPTSTAALANSLLNSNDGTYYADLSTVDVMNSYAMHMKQIATLTSDADLLAIPGQESSAVFQIGNDMLLVEWGGDGNYYLRRLGTTVADEAARILFQADVATLLSATTQAQQLLEADVPSSLTLKTISEQYFVKNKLDFDGPMGVYYQEIFFHIPHLIANALNAQGNYESAQQWFQYIFDPTATDHFTVTVSGANATVTDPVTGKPTTISSADVAQRLLDRVWRYLPLRGIAEPTLRGILTDPTTIKLYQQDPFNPWAIARARLSAYQKAMVMDYVSNALDWADSLFTQFTTESVSEAMMLYIMASELLGPRPVPLGDCDTGLPANEDSYSYIEPHMGADGADFLIEIETWTTGARVKAAAPVVAPTYVVAPFNLATALAEHPLAAAASASGSGVTGNALELNVAKTLAWGPPLGNATTTSGTGGRAVGPYRPTKFAGVAGFGWGVVREIITPVFCVPVNPNLIALWDTLDDRLYKIRNCENIDGVAGLPALFAPPINPLQLIELEAAGLSLDDVLGTSNGDLPPYRFVYMIEKAKAYASTLAGFGSSLLSALEKKDAEALNQLRLTQQLNLATQTTATRQMEIDAAQAAYDGATAQLTSAEDRAAYYASLLSGGYSSGELAEILLRNEAIALRDTQEDYMLAAQEAALVPQFGAPTAITYGGVQVSGSISAQGGAIGAEASALDAMAIIVSSQASFARRAQEWQFQLQMANDDVKTLTQQQLAAQIRLSIANAAMDLQQTSLTQMNTYIERNADKFTNLGLYTWLSGQLQTVYRGAFQNALALANLAQQAFQFERCDYTAPTLAGSYWDSPHAGLLAGERLLADLQTLEARFIETNYRLLELDQPFALSQIAARALIDLRETGTCLFTVPEAFFDLFYPGHYMRQIKAVRLTIPCVTGPYTNVSASLVLTDSYLRQDPTSAPPTPPKPQVLPTRSSAVAASSAQNDGGVFELSFHDERYMPFEGLGAVNSAWTLTLPQLRQFDYQTINDVILSINYTAQQSAALRTTVEGTPTVPGELVQWFQSNSLQRVFSLRQDFSSAFTRLVHSPVNTAVHIDITDRSFPMFVQGRTLKVQAASAVLVRASSAGLLSGFALSIDGAAPLTAFASNNSAPGGLPSVALPSQLSSNLRAPHSIAITNAGGFAPTSPPPGDVSAVDATKLLDILFYVEYRFA